ncbi:heme exporter protein CcmD [Lichenifustis flavocetrariae]|uniref:Heme exporter protein D n=1 Tax=Lichenifustis flavocetrariae TaxID=2949735 RepID=A0AA41Z3D7_9HYPH|nr:heme exporter protein CcmD [Lichenifustis flavocetrariae]MCW6509610.1 heme exporter protein CcmD [Lichenifustis flavocetrariae]
MAVPHIGFILAAYALTLLVLGGTILALVYDQRTQKKLLARLSRNEQP